MDDPLGIDPGKYRGPHRGIRDVILAVRIIAVIFVFIWGLLAIITDYISVASAASLLTGGINGGPFLDELYLYAASFTFLVSSAWITLLMAGRMMDALLSNNLDLLLALDSRGRAALAIPSTGIVGGVLLFILRSKTEKAIEKTAV